MAPSIVPVAKALYLCDYAIYDHGTRKLDLYGLVNSIRAPSYPHVAKEFCVFAQLAGGLGQVAFDVEILSATTGVQLRKVGGALWFPNRNVTIHMVQAVHSCEFPVPGLYIVELHCNNQWVADTTLLLQ